MDKALFVGMGGQNNALRELEMLSNNLANVNTPGFRGDYEVVKQHHIKNEGMESRVYASVGESYTDFKQGPVLKTGRELDLAVSGHGMFAVQSKSGREGYTRAGNFEISGDGFLVNAQGNLVMGDSGMIRIPPAEKVQIGEDGTVSVKPIGEQEMVTIGKIKLIMPDIKNIEKGDDGLFFAKNGATYPDDKNIKIQTGALEGSNVDPVETLIKLIDISRSYDIHSNFIKGLSEQATEANKLLDTKA